MQNYHREDDGTETVVEMLTCDIFQFNWQCNQTMNVNFMKWFVSVVAAFSAAQSFAEPVPDWANSYSADGICYCAPEVQASLRNKIVATPVGGQTISQVCDRIGKGPGLQLNGDQFSFPAYHDAQCGNGPIGADADGCEGRTQNDDTICAGTGPEWDLKAAYSKPAKEVVDTAAVEAEADKAAEVALAEQQAAARAKTVKAQSAKTAKARSAKSVKARQAKAAKARAKYEREDAALAKKLAEESLAKGRRESESEEQIEQEQIAKRQADEARLKAVAAENATNARLAKERQQRADAARLQKEQQDLASQQSSKEDKAARIRAAAAKAATVRAAADAKAKKEADEQLANSTAVDNVESGVDPVIESGTATGFRLPSYASLSNGQNGYVEVGPITFDFGGAGASLAGGYQWAPSWQFAGRAAMVEEYFEIMLGVRKTFISNGLNGAQINFLAGMEHGNFDGNFAEGIANLSDSGVILSGSLGYNVGRRANLSAGVKYSSFFEGDPGLFGLFLFRVVQNLDFSTRVEGGDNANLSLGLRYHY